MLNSIDATHSAVSASMMFMFAGSTSVGLQIVLKML